MRRTVADISITKGLELHTELHQMEAIFFFIAAAGASIQAIIGLGFFISCVWEEEPRATIFSGIQFLLMLGLVILLFYLNTIGFFETISGLTLTVFHLTQKLIVPRVKPLIFELSATSI